MKKRVRALVDKLGPKIFKNFEKMRYIMFDKDKGIGSSKSAIKPVPRSLSQADRIRD